MTPTLPRPIEPGEATIGRTVRAECRTGAYATIIEGVVSAIEGDRIGLGVNSDDNSRRYLTGSAYSWTLLSRPTPAPAVGSRWRDPNMNDAEYVRTAMESYRGYTAEALSVLMQPENADIIARLTPIPDHGDGCSPWLWDKETGTAWVAGHLIDRDGTPASLVQVNGISTWSGLIGGGSDLAKRLRPWSERGQANG